MALKWHHKNISNKIIVVIEFWWSLDTFFGLFDCDCTQNHVSFNHYILNFFTFTLLLHTHTFTFTKRQCTNMVPCKFFVGVWMEVYILYTISLLWLYLFVIYFNWFVRASQSSMFFVYHVATLIASSHKNIMFPKNK
jgi:hypothetical protein